MFVYVESNGILKTMEQTLYVGDTFDTFLFDEVLGDEISIGVTSSGMELTPVGKTNQGREVELEEVTYTFADPSVAKMEQQDNGTVKLVPVKSAETDLTVTARAEGAVVTKTYHIIVLEEQKFVEDNIPEIYEDVNRWSVGGGSLDINDEKNQAVASLTSYAYYTGEKYYNELFPFQIESGCPRHMAQYCTSLSVQR